MRKLLRDFWTMTAKKLVIFGQNVEGKMSAESGIYSAPTPPISSLTAKRLQLEAAIVAAEKGSLVQRQDRDTLKLEYKQMLLQLMDYVGMAVSNDAELMERSGYTLSKIRVKPGVPEVIAEVVVSHPGYSGEISLSWPRSQGAISYTVQYREDGVSYWSASTFTKGKATVSFLEPHKKYIFRVAAVGSAGQSPWSVEVPVFVL